MTLLLDLQFIHYFGYLFYKKSQRETKRKFNVEIKDYYEYTLSCWVAEDLAALDGELADEEDYLDISRYGIVEVVGDDSAGRKIIVVSACKLPPVGKEAFNHAKLLRFVT